MNVIIHGGFHKTGTTSYQLNLFPRLEKISNGEIIYNPNAIYKIFTDKWKRDIYNLSNEEIQTVDEFIENCKAHTIFISAECFSGDLFTGYRYEDTTRKLLALREWLHNADNVILIFTEREPVDWIKSCYREAVKDHHYIDIEEFLKNFEIREKNTLVLHQQRILSEAKRLGFEVHILDYDDLLKNDALCHKIISLTSASLNITAPREKRNVSLSWTHIFWLVKIKKTIFGCLFPKPIIFKGTNSIYHVEHKLNQRFYGKVFKKVAFLFRRGRWMRYINRAIARSTLLRDRKSETYYEDIVTNSIKKFNIVGGRYDC